MTGRTSELRAGALVVHALFEVTEFCLDVGGAGFCAESEGLLLAFFGFAPDRPVFERGFGDDGDAVVLAVTELASSQVAASCRHHPRELAWLRLR